MITGRVLGVDELLKNIGDMVDTLKAEDVIEDLMGAAEVIRESASDRAPRLTGQLSSDILIERVPDKLAVKVGPSKASFYGLFQEFGYGHSSARPFMRPAFDENKETFIEHFGDNLKSRLRFKDGRKWRQRTLIRKKRVRRAA